MTQITASPLPNAAGLAAATWLYVYYTAGTGEI